MKRSRCHFAATRAQTRLIHPVLAVGEVFFLWLSAPFSLNISTHGLWLSEAKKFFFFNFIQNVPGLFGCWFGNFGNFVAVNFAGKGHAGHIGGGPTPEYTAVLHHSKIIQKSYWRSFLSKKQFFCYFILEHSHRNFSLSSTSQRDHTQSHQPQPTSLYDQLKQKSELFWGAFL